MIRIRCRRLALAGLVALAAGLAGCGGDDEKAASATTQRVYRAPTTGQTTPEDLPATTTTPAAPTETAPAEPPPTSTTGGTPSPGGEDKPGGGGDEEPARTEVTLKASSSGVSPARANVAPYIAVRVTLVSKDGSARTLAIGGHQLKVGGSRKSAFVELPGLRPGASYSGRSDGGQGVRIVAAAEPGP